MNKKEFVAILAEKTGVSKSTVEKILNAEKEVVLEAVKKGEEVKTAVGKFFSATTAAREGVNPQDPSKKIKIPSKKVVKFKVFPSLKVIA